MLHGCTVHSVECWIKKSTLSEILLFRNSLVLPMPDGGFSGVSATVSELRTKAVSSAELLLEVVLAPDRKNLITASSRLPI